MTKLLFQLPTPQALATDESKGNAAHAMLGVVAIIAIVSMVFLFQHIMVVPTFGDGTGFVVYKANELCADPGMIVTDNSIVDYLKERQHFKCAHTTQDAWCCYAPQAK